MNRPGQIIHPELATEEELDIAEFLKNEGKTIEFIPERHITKTPDAFVDGIETEFKTVMKPTANNLTVRNKIRDAKSQSSFIIIDARITNISVAEVRRGIARGLGAYESVQSVRVIGKKFDITIKR